MSFLACCSCQCKYASNVECIWYFWRPTLLHFRYYGNSMERQPTISVTDKTSQNRNDQGYNRHHQHQHLPLLREFIYVRASVAPSWKCNFFLFRYFLLITNRDHFLFRVLIILIWYLQEASVWD